MKNTRKLLLGLLVLVLLALGGYLVTGGSFNFSPEDGAGSGIDGVTKAEKYKSESANAEVSLDGEEAQQRPVRRYQ